MTREWKPGDVAISKGCRVMRTGTGWLYSSGSLVNYTHAEGESEEHISQDARPLVVLDPDSVEQMESLAKAYYDLGDDWFEPGPKAMSIGAYRMQALVRSLITPPEPDEEPGSLAEVLGQILDRLDRLEGKKS